ncbi:AI-2E family transporter [Myxococcus xanthus]|uniref:AI-2E family transporter n=1 Tax=Myxococcus xanthus TaxID=34 RepID=A0A7Y4ILK6_MYXXA|nr:AI-2E family transporter [Myxococcus xanthus]NOJ81513.1 AI-2E family transporter [Myxococcus xanthus]NOJ88968.1 AI-2E family transporter [Myxococcus xanthus]
MKASRRQLPVYVPPRTVWIVGLQVLLLILCWAALRALYPVLTLLAVVLLLSIALSPLVRRLTRWGLPRGAGVAIVALALLGMMGVLVGSLVPMLIHQLQALVQSMPAMLERLAQSRWVEELSTRYGVQVQVEDLIRFEPTDVAGRLINVLSSTLGLVAGGITVVVLTVFSLLFGEDLYESTIQWVSPRRQPRVRLLMSRMRKAVANYLAGTLLVMTIGGTVAATMALIQGVPYFLPLGLMVMMMGVIPYLGSIISAVLVGVITLAAVGLKDALIAVAVFIVYQQIESNVLGPMIQRRAIKMNPLLISIVVLCGGALAGLPGVVLAVPLAAAAQVLVHEVLGLRQEAWQRSHRMEASKREPGRGAVEEGLLFAGPMAGPRPSAPPSREPPPPDTPSAH